MFKKVILVLMNQKKIGIKIKSVKIKDLDIEFEMPLKYYGFFSSQEQSLKEGYFKSLFTKSRVFTFDLNIIPEYEVKNGKLIVKTKLEEF